MRQALGQTSIHQAGGKLHVFLSIDFSKKGATGVERQSLYQNNWQDKSLKSNSKIGQCISLSSSLLPHTVLGTMGGRL